MIDLIKQSYSDTPKPYDGMKAVGDIVLEMRKDMLGKTSLTHRDFEYTDVIPPPNRRAN